MPRRYSRLALLAVLALPLAATGQHKLTAVGLNVGTGLLMPHLQTETLPVQRYLLSNNKSDDFIGSHAYQAGLYLRFENEDKWWLVQPEAQLTYGASSYVSVHNDPSSSRLNTTEYYERVVKRADLALLGGARISEVGSFVLGPVLATNFAGRTPTAESPENQAMLDALAATPRQLQLLGRAGFVATLGRVDLRVTYEAGLTPYTHDLRYEGQTYKFGVNNHLVMASLGLRLYHKYL